jgi:hypothetical protein
LCLLGVAAARAGHPADGAALVGYADANLHTYPRDTLPLAWIQTAIDDALSGLADRADQERAGAASTRREIQEIVNHLGAVADAT